MGRLLGGAGGGREEEWAPRSGANKSGSDNANNSSKQCPPASRHLQPQPRHHGYGHGHAEGDGDDEREDQDQRRARDMRASVCSISRPLLSTEQPVAAIHTHQPAAAAAAFNVINSRVYQDSQQVAAECHSPLPATSGPPTDTHSQQHLLNSSPIVSTAGEPPASGQAESSLTGCWWLAEEEAAVSQTQVQPYEPSAERPGVWPATSAYLADEREAAGRGCGLDAEPSCASSMKLRRCSGRNKPTRNTSTTANPETPQHNSKRQRPTQGPRRRPQVRTSRRGYSHTGSMCPSWRQLVLLMFVSVAVTSILASLSLTNHLPVSACFFMKHCHALATEPAPQRASLQPAETGAGGDASGTQVVAGNESSRLEALLEQSLRATTTEPSVAASFGPAGLQVPVEAREEPQFEPVVQAISRLLIDPPKMSSPAPPPQHQDQHRQQTINHRTDFGTNTSGLVVGGGTPHNHQPGPGKLAGFGGELADEQQHQFSSTAASQLESLYSSSRLEPLERPADTKPKSESVSPFGPPSGLVGHSSPEAALTRHQLQLAKQSKFVPLVPIAQAASSSSNAIKVIAAPLFTDSQRDWGARAAKKPTTNATSAGAHKRPAAVSSATKQVGAAQSSNSSKYHKDSLASSAKHTASSSLRDTPQPAQVSTSQLKSHSLLGPPIVAEPPLDTSFILTNNIPELSQLTYLNELLAAHSAMSHSQPLVGMHQHTLMSPTLYQHPSSSSVYKLGSGQRPNQPASSGGHLTSGRAQVALRQPSRPLVSVSSASAPSVSLPPLTHLLVPRNPFRLFSSSSSPLATRYRPSFLATRDHLKQQNFRGKGRQHNYKQVAGHRPSTGGHSATNYAWSAPSMHHQHHLDASASVAKAFQGHAKLSNLANHHDTNRLYAHAHSVEQLEQLIRAASQIDGVRSPILPAIVSASTGQTFPGLYIPAIETDSESQIQEIKHGERLPLGATNSMAVAYKIPGTDYILHPEEVKAMMSIGENAWRQSSQNQVSASEHVSSASSNSNEARKPAQQVSAAGRLLDGWRKKNYLKENHAQNIRDFAYVDSPVPMADQVPVPSSNSMLQLQHQTSNYPLNVTQYMLGPILSQQVRLGTFPPFIRLHNQDYVRWQLVGGSPSTNKPVLSSAAQVQHPHIYWSPQSLPLSPGSAVPYRQPASSSSSSSNGFRMQTSSSSAGAQQVPVLLASSSASSASTSGDSDITNENSPIRLATQLTPSEISQVEDSILEALLVSQQVERQQNMMRIAAATVNPFYLRPISVQLAPLVPQQPQVKSPQESKASQKRLRKAGGLFKRRRERKSSQEMAQTTPGRSKKAAKSKKQRSVSGQPPAAPPPSNQTVTLALASLYSPTRVEFVAAPVLKASIGDNSKLGERPKMPVLMAEQETNKPLGWNSMFDLGDASLDASETRLHKRYLMQPDDFVRSSGRQVRHIVAAHEDPLGGSDRDNCDGDSSSFGSRVGAAVCKHPTSKPKPEMARHTNRHPSSSSERGNYLEGWPSDADYFPGTTAHHPRPPNPQSSTTNYHPKLHQPDPKQVTQQASSSRHNLASEVGGRGRHFLPSQLKLQFSQDYQAREGVPIYNNNVRAAGALDKPPAMLALMDSRRRATSRLNAPRPPVHRYPSNKPATAPVVGAREPASSDDDESHEEPEDRDESSALAAAANGPEEDLWLKGSAPAGSKASQSTHSPKTPKKTVVT